MEDSKKQKQHFVLVHGACHGAWCWYKVVTRLRSEGHRVTALDMAASGADPRRAQELSSISDYYRPLMELMEGLAAEERVVVVGHSMGGICVSVAMDKFPRKIAIAVFVTAFMPGPHFALSALIEEHQRQAGSYMDSHYSFGNGDDHPPTSILFGPQFMASQLYQLSPPQVNKYYNIHISVRVDFIMHQDNSQDLTLATLATRPLPIFGGSDFSEELSEENYGSVGRAFIVCEQDNILKQGFQEWMIQNNPVDEVKMIYGADHMVMLSKSNELCDILNDLAYKHCL